MFSNQHPTIGLCPYRAPRRQRSKKRRMRVLHPLRAAEMGDRAMAGSDCREEGGSVQATLASYPAPQAGPQEGPGNACRARSWVQGDVGPEQQDEISSWAHPLPSARLSQLWVKTAVRGMGHGLYLINLCSPSVPAGCRTHRRRSAELLLAEKIKTEKHDFHSWTYYTIIAQNLKNNNKT